MTNIDSNLLISLPNPDPDPAGVARQGGRRCREVMHRYGGVGFGAGQVTPRNCTEGFKQRRKGKVSWAVQTWAGCVRAVAQARAVGLTGPFAPSRPSTAMAQAIGNRAQACVPPAGCHHHGSSSTAASRRHEQQRSPCAGTSWRGSLPLPARHEPPSSRLRPWAAPPAQPRSEEQTERDNVVDAQTMARAKR